LRNLKDDFHGLGKNYFPEITDLQFNDQIKKQIEKSKKKILMKHG